MIRKCLEKKVKMIPDEQSTEFAAPFELEYYLIESDITHPDELMQDKVYGVEIVKKNVNEKVEREIIKDLSCCRKNTENILNKLVNNTVTPVCLSHILDDIIGV